MNAHIVFNDGYKFQEILKINQETFKVNKTNRLLYRLFDFSFSLVAILIFMPIMLMVALFIKINSPKDSILFRQKRLGLDGKLFYVYKFRTMVPNATERLKEMLAQNPKVREEFEKDFKLKNDPRIIPNIGSFLRKSSLDELPQFFNVLLGNMSVVGPRPIISEETFKYGKYASKLFSIKPGVTGLWQVSGRNDIDYNERVALDMQYIDNKSILFDIKIIIKTVSVIFFKKGAY